MNILRNNKSYSTWRSGHDPPLNKLISFEHTQNLTASKTKLEIEQQNQDRLTLHSEL